VQGSLRESRGAKTDSILYDIGCRRGPVQLAVAQTEQATVDYQQRVLVAFQEVENNLTADRGLPGANRFLDTE
jgi:outer membrane protein TolC